MGRSLPASRTVTAPPGVMTMSGTCWLGLSASGYTGAAMSTAPVHPRLDSTQEQRRYWSEATTVFAISSCEAARPRTAFTFSRNPCAANSYRLAVPRGREILCERCVPQTGRRQFITGRLGVQTDRFSLVELRDREMVVGRSGVRREFLHFTLGHSLRNCHPVANMVSLQPGQVLDHRQVAALWCPLEFSHARPNFATAAELQPRSALPPRHLARRGDHRSGSRTAPKNNARIAITAAVKCFHEVNIFFLLISQSQNFFRRPGGSSGQRLTAVDTRLPELSTRGEG